MKKLILLICMGILSSCFGQENEKRIYLAGWEAEFNGDEDCQKFIETQVIDKKTAYTVWSSIELVFTDNKLSKAYNHEEGQKTERKLNESEIGLEYTEIQPHQIFQLNKSRSSKSYLGGEAPSEFTTPTFEFNAPFQYLGKFSKSDEPFAWLPFDLHLVAPIYLNFDKLYIDYSDPMNPRVIDVETLSETDTSYDDLKPNSEIVYKKVYVTGRKSNNYSNGVAHTGVPAWIQYPDIPTCPKSKKTMRFLCQITSDVVDTERTNVQPKDEWYKQYFNNMNFWGDGDLYIFFDPESKVACFIIQNT
ncbi:hypothetical protein [Dokdonia sp.]|uniref:hypothetical protein n=1 Tax=Dokdonia sp. TaxID=2024995 RepID=UPI00326306E6